MQPGRPALPVALAVLAVLSVLAPLAAVPAAASTPPEPVCPVCELDRGYANDATDVELKVTRSTVEMRVRDDGSARFRARVAVDDATADALADDRSAVDAVVAEAFEYRYVGHERGAQNVTATFGDGELVVGWTIPDAARDGPGGTTLVTLFGESNAGITLHADRLELYGPEGSKVANSPQTGVVEEFAADADGSRDGERVAWNGDADYESRAHLDDGTYVAFAPNDDVLARANAELSVALAVGPTMLSDALVAGGPSAVVLAVLLGACLFVLGGSARPERDASVLAALAGVVVLGGGLYALVGGYGPLSTRNFELLALPAGIAAFGVLSARAPAVANLREAALRVAATVGVGGGVAFALSTSFLSVMAAIVAVAVGGFYLVGVYDQRVGWPVAAVTALVLATPVLGVLPSTPVGGFGPGFVGFLLTPMALVAALLGVVAYRIGAGNAVAGDRVVDARTTA